ncbi:hypothetical protein D3C71_859490 [compost metagenome]|jgi:hypothetical protein
MLVVFGADLNLIGFSHSFGPVICEARRGCQPLRRPILASSTTGSMPMTTIARAAIDASS